VVIASTTHYLSCIPHHASIGFLCSPLNDEACGPDSHRPFRAVEQQSDHDPISGCGPYHASSLVETGVGDDCDGGGGGWVG